LEIGKWLVSQGAEVAGFDPALSNPTDVLPIKLAIDPYQASSEADVLILITEWPEFKSLDFHKIKIGMKGNLIFDTKNILNPVELKTEGFKYFGTGISNEI
jgi:UDPglucose 6-dehydrogenase